MVKKFHKYKLLLDENFPTKKYLPLTNNYFDLHHIVADEKQKELPDEKVYLYAKKLKRIIVTFNGKDFKTLVNISKNTGVIDVSANMLTADIDKKLTALLIKSKPAELYGKLTIITGETKR